PINNFTASASQLGSQSNPYPVYQGWQGAGYYYFPAHNNYQAGYMTSVCQLNAVNVSINGGNLGSPYDISSCVNNNPHPTQPTNQNNNQPNPTPPNLTLYSPSVNGLTATINGVTSPTTSGASITRISWDWGDGQTSTGWFPLSHTYSNSGTYTVKVTSYDSNGYWRWATDIVTVTALRNTPMMSPYHSITPGTIPPSIPPTSLPSTPYVAVFGNNVNYNNFGNFCRLYVSDGNAYTMGFSSDAYVEFNKINLISVTNYSCSTQSQYVSDNGLQFHCCGDQASFLSTVQTQQSIQLPSSSQSSYCNTLHPTMSTICNPPIHVTPPPSPPNPCRSPSGCVTAANIPLKHVFIKMNFRDLRFNILIDIDGQSNALDSNNMASFSISSGMHDFNIYAQTNPGSISVNGQPLLLPLGNGKLQVSNDGVIIMNIPNLGTDIDVCLGETISDQYALFGKCMNDYLGNLTVDVQQIQFSVTDSNIQDAALYNDALDIAHYYLEAKGHNAAQDIQIEGITIVKISEGEYVGIEYDLENG
ncbi:MAG: PKD domain-containing protein, partial [Nitrosotalea sp.]